MCFIWRNLSILVWISWMNGNTIREHVRESRTALSMLERILLPYSKAESLWHAWSAAALWCWTHAGPVHIVHASRVALFMNKWQGIPRYHFTQWQMPSFYIKEMLMNGSRLRVNLCFPGLFLILGQPSDTLYSKIHKTPGVVKIAGKVTSDGVQQECVKWAFLSKQYYETVVLDGFPRVAWVGKHSLIQRRQGTGEGLLLLPA